MILSIKQHFCHLRYSKKKHTVLSRMSFESRRIPCAFMLYVYHHPTLRGRLFLPVNRFIYAKHIATGRAVSHMTLFLPVHSSLIFRLLQAPFFTLTVLVVRPHIPPSCRVASLPAQTKPEAAQWTLEGSVCAASGDLLFRHFISRR